MTKKHCKSALLVFELMWWEVGIHRSAGNEISLFKILDS